MVTALSICPLNVEYPVAAIRGGDPAFVTGASVDGSMLVVDLGPSVATFDADTLMGIAADAALTAHEDIKQVEPKPGEPLVIMIIGVNGVGHGDQRA